MNAWTTKPPAKASSANRPESRCTTDRDRRQLALERLLPLNSLSLKIPDEICADHGYDCLDILAAISAARLGRGEILPDPVLETVGLQDNVLEQWDRALG